LDLYAGTGSLGIEALSRGAAHVTFVEEDRVAGRILRANLERCRGSSSQDLHIGACRVESFLRDGCQWQGPYDLVLADPPYAQTDDFVETIGVVPEERFAAHTRLVIEHGKKMALRPRIGIFRLLRRYDYGDTALSLFLGAEESPASS
jgi:16S rRNA (guanine(966)-N(2))-methyltransferase RsmD